MQRALLIVSAVLLAAGSAIHTTAFRGLQKTLATAILPPTYASFFRVLWLADSLVLLVIALLFAFTRPERVTIVLLALVPAGTAALMFSFIGPKFPPAYLLLAAAVAAFIAGVHR